MREKRKKIWIDRFQTYLAWRISLYFILYQILVWMSVLLSRQIITIVNAALGQGAMISGTLGFLVLLVLMVSFLFIYDAVKFVHRIVGPTYRFRKAIQAINAGEEVHFITLRQGDFLQDMKDDFNEMLKLLEQRGAVVVVKPTHGAKKQEQAVTV